MFDSIVDRRDHPTADRVYDQVRTDLPSVSRMTVYRVLEWLVEVGVVAKIDHPGPTIRFDPTTERHHHLVCVRCDRLVDLDCRPADDLELPEALPQGFVVDDYSVVFRGLCASCQCAGDGARSGQEKKTQRTRD